MEKINVAELLKNCPSGMELDCIMFEDNCMEFDGIVDNEFLPIRCRIKNSNGGYNVYNFTKYGCWIIDDKAKCVIFPKGKSTWEGFQRPFKDGDILYINYGGSFKYIAIFKQIISNTVYVHTYYSYYSNSFNIDNKLGDANTDIRFATEEEKQKLFKAIKDNGYKWYTETKTLEELVEPKFKVGDRIKKKGDTRLMTIKDVRDNYYIITFPDYFGNCYITDKLSFSKQGDYELVPNKFGISTLMPFDKVLVRDSNTLSWTNSFYSNYDVKDIFPFHCINLGKFKQCIPYEGNEHLLGTTDDCDEFYKFW